MGGEPFLHPDLCEIVDLVLEYKNDRDPLVNIEIITNGYGTTLDALRSDISTKITVESTYKNAPVGNKFDAFNLAPRDDWRYGFTDFSSGCWIPAECGIGLTPFGYYHCAIAGGIDRILGLDLSFKSLPGIDEGYKMMMRKLCPWCGHFRIGYHESSKLKELLNEQHTSKSWEKTYKEYGQHQPNLTRY